jgi:hypothetical protein
VVSNEEVQSEVKRRFARVTSNKGRAISVWEWDDYINEAYRHWVKSRVAVAETNSDVRYGIRKLEVPDAKLTIKERTDQYVIAELPKDYYVIQKVVVKATCVGCDKEQELTIGMMQVNDWSETYRDPMWKPSFLWRTTFADENNKGLKIGVSDFTVTQVMCDYYRLPEVFYSPELSDSYEGALRTLGSTNKPFELDLFQMDEVVDIAVYFASRDSGSFAEAKSQYEKVMFTKN